MKPRPDLGQTPHFSGVASVIETRERFERAWLDLRESTTQPKVLAVLANSQTSPYSQRTMLTVAIDCSRL